MNKPFLFMLSVLLASLTQVQGQSCIPNQSIPDSVAVDPLPYTMENPERGIQDTACVDAYFETYFQINLPPTAVILGNEVPLTRATIPTTGAVRNLPASMSYVCNPPNCVFTPDSVGCIVLFGTPTNAEVGVHDLKIGVTLLLAGALNYATELPDANLAPGNYYLTVREAAGANCTVDTEDIRENAFGVKVQPNPLSDYAVISANLPSAGSYTFTLYNALGHAVQQQQYRLPAGEQTLQFDGSTLPVGLYIFTLGNGSEAASGRLLIQR